jgi:hypothetical protein
MTATKRSVVAAALTLTILAAEVAVLVLKSDDPLTRPLLVPHELVDVLVHVQMCVRQVVDRSACPLSLS